MSTRYVIIQNAGLNTSGRIRRLRDVDGDELNAGLGKRGDEVDFRAAEANVEHVRYLLLSHNARIRS
jgi:hypothetical protein